MKIQSKSIWKKHQVRFDKNLLELIKSKNVYMSSLLTCLIRSWWKNVPILSAYIDMSHQVVVKDLPFFMHKIYTYLISKWMKEGENSPNGAIYFNLLTFLSILLKQLIPISGDLFLSWDRATWNLASLIRTF